MPQAGERMKNPVVTFVIRRVLAGVWIASTGLLVACASDPVRPEVHTSETGLQYIDFVVGSGAYAEPGQTVTLDYTARLLDGTKFDSSLDHGETFQFVIGGGHVIPGFDEGVRHMRVGGHRRLIIPPSLAYGDRGIPGIVPPGAIILFDLDLLGVSPPQAWLGSP
jgi:FKBP-type peptidyl-prolyl cis-trans isomerase